jgi:hypothetical protein
MGDVAGETSRSCVGSRISFSAPVEMRTATIFRLDPRQVVRIDIFLDPAKALEAAGLQD